jgi:hypothetical protein
MESRPDGLSRGGTLGSVESDVFAKKLAPRPFESAPCACVMRQRPQRVDPPIAALERFPKARRISTCCAASTTARIGDHIAAERVDAPGTTTF